nr:Chain H, Photosystem I reaction center subunit VI, chloroplast [Spinacia oleracea]
WDVYGSDAPSPYNSLQSKFFETFAAPFTKRGLLLKFLILGGGSLLTYVSANAPQDVLPITRGPQQPPKLGPRGKI